MNLNLDDLTRDDAPEPFVVHVGGKDVRFSDPSDLNWREVADLNAGDPEEFLRSVVAADDSDHFFAQDIAAWKMNRLFESYLKHFKLA